MLYKPYQRVTFKGKKYMNTYGYLGCFNCAEESCKEINKSKLCGQKDNKRKDKGEFIFKELSEDDLKKENEFIKSVKVRELKESVSNRRKSIL